MHRSRRSLLTSAAATAAFAQPPKPILKPKALRPGDTVGLITPSTYVSDPEKLQLARITIEALGLKAKLGRGVGRRNGYLGGTIAERIADLHAMFSDPEVRAVLCVRGGYGAAMLLDRIDFGLIRRNPKLFVGYSDITALHLGIHGQTGLVTMHGPVVLSRFNDWTLGQFKRAIFDPRPLGTLRNPPEERPIRPRHLTRTVRPGSATGPLIGGNLSLVCSTLGTPWEIQTAGRILFLEDVDEPPYRVDRMLTHLRLAGKFRGIRGLMIGECADCVPNRPSSESGFSLGEIYDSILGDLQVPVLTGLAIGHTDDQLTLPLGVEATLDAAAATLTIDEAATTE